MKIGFIGTGNMGGAILKGYAKSDAAKGNVILVHNRSTEHNEFMAKAIEERLSPASEKVIRVCNDNCKLAEESDIIILGVKPHDIPSVMKEIATYTDNKIIVSMAAGVSIASLEEALGEKGKRAKIVRIMPNTPAMVGEAITSMSRNGNVDDIDFEAVKSIFDVIGICEGVPEELIDCVIGVSGSSPAYTYMYIQALAEAAAANGMEPDQARNFAAQAVLGAARMVLESSESLEQLRINVCSPGGATIEAVKVLQKNGFMDNVKEGFQAAVDRSKEMTKE